MRTFPLLILIAATACLGFQQGCSAPSPTRGGFDSAAPAARTHAVEVTVRNAHANGVVSRADLESMVGLLLADDDLVRFMAIAGLEDLTGETMGYRFYDRPETRFQAVIRWRDHVRTAARAGTLRIEPPLTDAQAPAPTVDSAEAAG